MPNNPIQIYQTPRYSTQEKSMLDSLAKYLPTMPNVMTAQSNMGNTGGFQSGNDIVLSGNRFGTGLGGRIDNHAFTDKFNNYTDPKNDSVKIMSHEIGHWFGQSNSTPSMDSLYKNDAIYRQSEEYRASEIGQLLMNALAGMLPFNKAVDSARGISSQQLPQQPKKYTMDYFK